MDLRIVTGLISFKFDPSRVKEYEMSGTNITRSAQDEPDNTTARRGSQRNTALSCHRSGKMSPHDKTNICILNSA
jgi:hypothetical protein